MVLRIKNFNVLGVHGKIRLLGGGFMKNQYRGGNCLKGGGLRQFADLKGGGLARKRGVVFLKGGGVDTPMHTMGHFKVLEHLGHLTH